MMRELTNVIRSAKIMASRGWEKSKMAERHEIPEFYSDGVEIGLTMPWTVALTFSLKDTTKERKPKPQVIVRMSPEQAKVAVMLLKRLLKNYELESGSPINLPKDLWGQLGLPPEDW
jgi:hypothetical protein